MPLSERLDPALPKASVWIFLFHESPNTLFFLQLTQDGVLQCEVLKMSHPAKLGLGGHPSVSGGNRAFLPMGGLCL